MQKNIDTLGTMKMLKLISLETEKVKLSPLTDTHLSDLFTAGSHPDIWRWVLNNYCESEEKLGLWFKNNAQFNQNEQIVMAIINKPCGSVVGTTRLFRLDTHNQSAEIGHTFIAKSAQKTYVNTHAKYLLLSHAFEALDLVRVTFCTHENNIISRNAISRLGARFEGVAYKHRKLTNGNFRNTAIFSITDEQWPAIKTKLISRMHETKAATS